MKRDQIKFFNNNCVYLTYPLGTYICKYMLAYFIFTYICEHVMNMQTHMDDSISTCYNLSTDFQPYNVKTLEMKILS